MARFHSFKVRHIAWLIMGMGLLSIGFLQPLFMAPGIDTPSAINPYLNGAFPESVPGTPSAFGTENAFPNITLNSPFKIIKDPRGDRFFVAEKRGRISIFSTTNGGSNYETVVDFQDQVSQGGGTHGLMGFILHPEFGQAGSPNRNYFYVFYRYIPPGTPLTTEKESYRRLSRFELADGTNQAPKNSEQVMIQQFVRSRIHSGGGMVFDNKGFLILGLGDGGNCCEKESTQRLDKWLLGGIIRIDVDRRGGNISHPIRRQPTNYNDVQTNFPAGWEDSYSQHYYIPNDNPWQDPSGGTLEEFYALGIRHAYTLAYDPTRDEIWEGEIGQSTFEEINKIEKGANYEWPYLEATRVHNNGILDSEDGLSPKTIDEVIGPRVGAHIRLNRTTSNSVIAGLVYRGSRYPSLQGKFLFADHGRGTIYQVDATLPGGMDQDDITFVAKLPNTSMGFGIASFATDEAGDIYLVKLDGVNYDPNGPDTRDGGTIHKIVPTQSSPDPPALLSLTGAFSDLNTLSPSAGIVPYTVNSPLWSDRAIKKRWIALPNDGSHNSGGEQIEFHAESPWMFPPGTVIIKHFELPTDASLPDQTTRLETRFIVIGEGEEYYGVTYRWNESQTDAFLLTSGDTRDIVVKDENGQTTTQTWQFPSRMECLSCHTHIAGKVLGVNTHQLNGDFVYPNTGVESNQLETWAHLGMFDQDIGNPERYLRSVELNDPQATPTHKLFSYLDANCAHCHRPDGVEGAFDARMAIPFDSHNLINQATDGPNSNPDGVIIKPGSPAESELFIRDNSLGGTAMPPIAKSLVDQPYIEQLEDWIHSLVPNTTDYAFIGEVGQTRTDDTWRTVIFQHTYVDPVVIAGGLGLEGAQVAFPRIRNLTNNSFEIRAEEWSCLDVTHTTETISYIIVEAGAYTLSNGKKLIAGNVSTATHAWSQVNYPLTFDNDPVILGQVVSTHDPSPASIRINQSLSDQNGFAFRIQEDQGADDIHGMEKVSWISIEPGTWKKDLAFEMGIMNNISDALQHVSFQQHYAYKPIFLGKVGSYVGPDPAVLRYDHTSISGHGIDIFTQEETCLDEELTHANETIHYFLFEHPGSLLGQRISTPSVQLKVMLEGPYDSSLGQMKNVLSAQGKLGNTDPYGLGEILSPGLLSQNGEKALVDWIVIEVRSGIDPSQIVQSQAALVQANGTVISSNGNTQIEFEGLSGGSYFVALSHYNHLGVMTAQAMDLSENPIIDFTHTNTSTFSNGGPSQKHANGTLLLWAGDANGDGTINAIDRNIYWRNENGQAYIYGTTQADFNLDGTVNALDANLFWRINNSRIEQIP